MALENIEMLHLHCKRKIPQVIIFKITKRLSLLSFFAKKTLSGTGVNTLHPSLSFNAAIKHGRMEQLFEDFKK